MKLRKGWRLIPLSRTYAATLRGQPPRCRVLWHPHGAHVELEAEVLEDLVSAGVLDSVLAYVLEVCRPLQPSRRRLVLLELVAPEDDSGPKDVREVELMVAGRAIYALSVPVVMGSGDRA